jgi:hypothetical protein
MDKGKGTRDEPANHRLVNLPKAGEKARGMSEDEVEMVTEKQISR